MANRLRGEIEAVIDGRKWTLVLTLGALAELEAVYEVEDLAALAERFATGRLAARDVVRVVGAGLRGAGNAVDDDQVAAMTTSGGLKGFLAIAADLLRVTFADTEADTSATMGADMANERHFTHAAQEAGAYAIAHPSPARHDQTRGQTA